LEKANGKLQLVMKSERMVRIVEFDMPIMTRYGKVGATKKRATVYEYVFDEGQMRAMSEARKLTNESGLVLEVTDLSRQSGLRRMIRQRLSRISLAARIEAGSRQSPKTTPAEAQAKRGAVISQGARP
jgi:hypothetical protein